jgi:hypothetical protein
MELSRRINWKMTLETRTQKTRNYGMYGIFYELFSKSKSGERRVQCQASKFAHMYIVLHTIRRHRKVLSVTSAIEYEFKFNCDISLEFLLCSWL